MGNQFCQETTSSAVLSVPWRNSVPVDSELLTKLKTRVKSYNPPPNVGAQHAKILMLGPVGAGKSSFFNTIDTILEERFTNRGNTGSYSSSVTTMYREYLFRVKNAGSGLNFKLCDTCGIVAKGLPDLADLNYILEGNVPNGYEFSKKLIDPTITGFICNPELQDKVHCVVYVFAASSLKTIDDFTWNKLNELQSRLNEKGIPRVILLTKIDCLSESLAKDVSKVFLCAEVKEAVNCVSSMLHVPPGNVMPIKNYESEGILDTNISCLALQALDRMLGYADDYLVDQYDLMQLTQHKTA